jgi:indole-3-glycerol phosphate synthase
MTPDIPDVLQTIVARKRVELAEREARVPPAAIERAAASAAPVRDFAAALRAKIASGESAVIAEVKKASPSAGVIRADFDPAEIARAYQSGGAACLSVLTDVDFFQGHDGYLALARDACTLPVLRKDFMLASYQIFESRALGADCVLLIAAILGPDEMRELSQLALSLGMGVLAEVHDPEEMDRAIDCGAPLIGINNRDLRVFKTDLDTTLRLKARVPNDRLVVTESGIATRADVAKMRAADVHAFLVGESLMRQPDPGVALRALFAD